MTTVTKISLAMFLAGVSATALFFLRLKIGYTIDPIGALVLGVILGITGLYSCLSIATISNKKTRLLLILFFISMFVMSICFSELRKNNTGWRTRYIDYQ